MAKKNSTSHFYLFTLLLVTIFSGHFTHQATLPTGIYIFGDSTFDVGTNNFLNDSRAKANFPYNGIDYPDSVPTGRFSNGYNTADQIVKLFGLKRSPKPFFQLEEHSHSFKKMILQGVNFASGGSGILDSTGKAFTRVIPLRDQIKQFSTVHDNIVELMGPENTAMMLSQSLFLISIGGNDLFDLQRSGANLTASQDQFLADLQQTYRTHLQNLYDLGARKFGIVSIPPIGCCPSERSMSKNGECVKELNDLAQSFFNATQTMLQNISSQVEGMKYSLGNAFDMTFEIIDNPLVFGFKEVKEACCGNGRFNGEALCNTSASLCPRREEYLFWDWFHPSQAASRLAALTLFGGAERYVTPMNFSQLLF